MKLRLLNRAERVFEELRRVVQREVYGTIEDKMAAVDRELTSVTGSHCANPTTGWVSVGLVTPSTNSLSSLRLRHSGLASHLGVHPACYASLTWGKVGML